MEQDFPVWLAFLFPVFFAALWVSVTRVISWLGWSPLARRFVFDRPLPDGATRYGSQSLAIGDSLFTIANYSNCVNIWVDQRGLYMRPQIFFRLFHPMLHVRWDQIAAVEERKGLVRGGTRLSFRTDAPPVMMRGRSGRAVAEHWHSYGGGSRA